MKIVIWGIGVRGKRIFDILPKGMVVAIIDSNSKFQGKQYEGVPVVSFDTYKKDYKGINILVSNLIPDEIIKLLEDNNIDNYWLGKDEPSDINNLEGTKIFEIFEEIYNDKNRYLVNGSNLFAFCLFEYLLKKGNEVYMDIGNGKKYLKNKHYKKYKKYLVDKKNIKINKSISILLCDKNSLKEKKIGLNLNYIDATNNLTKIKKNNICDLKEFKNKFEGKRCFVIGNGPSLLMKDLDKLNECMEDTFAVNGIYKCENLTKWRPKYYVAEDYFCIKYQSEKFLNYNAEFKFVASYIKEFWKQVLPQNVKKFYSIRDSGGFLEINEDICCGVYARGTVLHDCIHMAIYMGYKEIYIIGADTTDYIVSKRNHFVENYHEEIKNIVKPKLFVKDIFMGYLKLKKFAKEKNVKIYNATRGGKLEVFERVDFEKIFEK